MNEFPPLTCRADFEQLRRSFVWPRREHFNFATDVFDEHARRRPGAIALHWIDDAPSVGAAASGAAELRLSFAELAERSRRLAVGLRRQGLVAGDRVLVLLPRVPAWWETMLGLCRADLAAMPGTTSLTPRDLRYRLEASGAVAVVTDAARADAVDEATAELTGLRCKVLVGPAARDGWTAYESVLDSASAEVELEATRSDSPALIYFTSGTTGPPKMVLHTHASYGQGHVVTGRLWLGLTEDDVHWNVSDTGWAKAAWSSYFGPWICGATVFARRAPGKFDPQQLLETLEQHPVSTLCAPPTVYRLLVKQDLSRFRPQSLRDCVAAGEPLNPEVIAVWREATGITIRDGYGQTESVLLCGNFPGLPVRPGSMGLAAPGFDLAAIDEQGVPLRANEEGDLAVRVEPERPLGLFREYFRNEAGTAATIRDGWYVTGDRARQDEDGYFWFVGRADDVITSSAYRIGPFDVESALIEHPAVLEAAVIGKPDAIRGEIVKAFVVLAEGYTPSESLVEELQQHVKRTTAPYKYPREVEFLAELPKTVSGKIRRVELRARERRG